MNKIYFGYITELTIASVSSEHLSSSEVCYLILWRNRPMREVITFRDFKERECATVAERCRVLPPLASFCVLLGYAVITWSRNRKEGRCELGDVTRNNTQCCFLRVSDTSIYRRDRRQCSRTRSMTSSMTSMSC
jgi:hypothetical protein